MAQETICILHPGEMGAAVGAAVRSAGARVLWVSSGRGDTTSARARAAGLEDAGTLRDALGASGVVLSVCPPHAAVAVAEAVSELRYGGIYVDANAISPETARRVGAIVGRSGATFVDGGIIGPPPQDPGRTRLYLAGSAAGRVATLFGGTALAAVVLDAPPGAASAVKMCYAAWTKGTAALLTSVRAVARAEGVENALADEWRISQPDLFRLLDRAIGNARKAWRWVGEMDEVAETFADAGLPKGFGQASAEVFARLESFKDARGTTLEELLAALAPVMPTPRRC
jgi:3-hydroxyisobutyrate dehydrogenase-like beta-hydroxyacid dehydrogenase